MFVPNLRYGVWEGVRVGGKLPALRHSVLSITGVSPLAIQSLATAFLNKGLECTETRASCQTNETKCVWRGHSMTR